MRWFVAIVALAVASGTHVAPPRSGDPRSIGFDQKHTTGYVCLSGKVPAALPGVLDSQVNALNDGNALIWNEGSRINLTNLFSQFGEESLGLPKQGNRKQNRLNTMTTKYMYPIQQTYGFLDNLRWSYAGESQVDTDFLSTGYGQVANGGEQYYPYYEASVSLNPLVRNNNCNNGNGNGKSSGNGGWKEGFGLEDGGANLDIPVQDWDLNLVMRVAYAPMSYQSFDLDARDPLSVGQFFWDRVDDINSEGSIYDYYSDGGFELLQTAWVIQVDPRSAEDQWFTPFPYVPLWFALCENNYQAYLQRDVQRDVDPSPTPAPATTPAPTPPTPVCPITPDLVPVERWTEVAMGGIETQSGFHWGFDISCNWFPADTSDYTSSGRDYHSEGRGTWQSAFLFFSHNRWQQEVYVDKDSDGWVQHMPFHMQVVAGHGNNDQQIVKASTTTPKGRNWERVAFSFTILAVYGLGRWQRGGASPKATKRSKSAKEEAEAASEEPGDTGAQAAPLAVVV